MVALFIILAVVVILASLAAAWEKTPAGKGFKGEQMVKKFIGGTIIGKQYVINDIMVTDEECKSSQIDHIVVNQNGIFVIETKNYSGTIYGKENAQEWVQSLNYGKRTNKFYNPVKQNATHIYRLRQKLQTDVDIHSVVVFVQGNIEHIESENVYDVYDIKGALQKEGKTKLSMKEMERLYFDIQNIKDKKTTNLEHVEKIEKMKEDIESGICPRCGGKLVERNGKNGKFLGCSNYPNCKFTKNI